MGAPSGQIQARKTVALALLTFRIDVVFAPPPTCSPLVKQVTQPRRVMQLIKTSLSLAKPPPVYFILLFSFDHTTLHWLPLPILPTVDCFGGAPSTTAVVHKLLFRPISSGEPVLKHHQLADWVQASLISVR